MNLRKDIESLAYCYIPTVLIMSLATFFYSFEIKNLFSDINQLTSSTVVFMSIINQLIACIDNIVVAIWLFIMSKRKNEKPILWFLFGLVAHLFAALIFLALKIYEKNVTSTDK